MTSLAVPNPFVLMALLLAHASEYSDRSRGNGERAEPTGTCRFCRAPLDGKPAEVEGHVTHPLNTCRYGKRGNGAIPIADCWARGTSYNFHFARRQA